MVRIVKNPNAIKILEENKDKIDWNYLSLNPNSINLLKKNQDKINWKNLSVNPSIFELDYNALKKRCNIYKEELIKKTMRPSRIFKYLEQCIEVENLDYFI